MMYRCMETREGRKWSYAGGLNVPRAVNAGTELRTAIQRRPTTHEFFIRLFSSSPWIARKLSGMACTSSGRKKCDYESKPDIFRGAG